MSYANFSLKPKWFSADNPESPKKANATLTFDGVVTDAETVTIGDNVYEFDIDESVTEGNILVDISELRNQAEGVLTFTGVVEAAQTVSIGDEVYEFVAAVGDESEGNIPVVMGEDLTKENAVLTLTDVINDESELVTAVGDAEVGDTVTLTAIVYGTGGNSITTTETVTNASFAEATLTGGLNTIINENGALAIAGAINENEDMVEATVDEGEVLVSYVLTGTEGNAVAVETDATNGSWGEAVEKLSGGQWGTPCMVRNTMVKDANYYYVCDKEGNRDNVSWKRFTLADY